MEKQISKKCCCTCLSPKEKPTLFLNSHLAGDGHSQKSLRADVNVSTTLTRTRKFPPQKKKKTFSSNGLIFYWQLRSRNIFVSLLAYFYSLGTEKQKISIFQKQICFCACNFIYLLKLFKFKNVLVILSNVVFFFVP